MTIIIADDHHLILDSLKSLLIKSYPDATILIALNKESLIQQLKSHHVDILVQDIKFGNNHAKDFLLEIKKKFGHLKILIISSISESSTINFFLKKTNGYILKTDPAIETIKGIDAVINGETYLSMGARKIINTPQIDDYIPLTTREKDVLKEVMKEQSNKQIASTLHISEKTVEMHKANIYLKLNVSNLTGLVKKVISLDILEGY